MINGVATDTELPGFVLRVTTLADENEAPFQWRSSRWAKGFSKSLAALAISSASEQSLRSPRCYVIFVK